MEINETMGQVPTNWILGRGGGLELKSIDLGRGTTSETQKRNRNEIKCIVASLKSAKMFFPNAKSACDTRQQQQQSQQQQQQAQQQWLLIWPGACHNLLHTWFHFYFLLKSHKNLILRTTELTEICQGREIDSTARGRGKGCLWLPVVSSQSCHRVAMLHWLLHVIPN